jgi:hypothetical protein
MARSLGLEQLQLTVRGGTGVELFYERFGYAVWDLTRPLFASHQGTTATRS